MHKTNKAFFFLAFQLLVFTFMSCSKNQQLVGTWENEERNLIITPENTFEIQNKNTKIVKAFRGNCFYSNSRLVLFFYEYKDIENIWYSLFETDLENHIEKITFQIKDNQLHTHIEETNQNFIYTKRN